MTRLKTMLTTAIAAGLAAIAVGQPAGATGVTTITVDPATAGFSGTVTIASGILTPDPEYPGELEGTSVVTMVFDTDFDGAIEDYNFVVMSADNSEVYDCTEDFHDWAVVMSEPMRTTYYWEEYDVDWVDEWADDKLVIFKSGEPIAQIPFTAPADAEAPATT
jgi:hypothetical protein